MIRQQYISREFWKKDFTDLAFSYRVNPDLDTITFAVTTEEKSIDSLQIDLHPLINQLMTDYGNFNINNIAPEKMMLSKESQTLKIKIYFRHMKLYKEESEIKPVQYSTDILYKDKRMD
jgi:hypothetical protein